MNDLEIVNRLLRAILRSNKAIVFALFALIVNQAVIIVMVARL